MRIRVTSDGVLIPKRILEGVDEVEVRKEGHAIVILPADRESDPIYELGRQPVVSDVDDASTEHDHYLYG